MKYNPTTYFKDHNDLVHKWRTTESQLEARKLEIEIEDLTNQHLRYVTVDCEALKS